MGIEKSEEGFLEETVVAFGRRGKGAICLAKGTNLGWRTWATRDYNSFPKPRRLQSLSLLPSLPPGLPSPFMWP